MDESTSFLMEKLRAKGGTFKSFKEYSKSLRMTLLEKRYALEVTEKNYLQECLDLLQQNILVSSLPAIIERLEVISRHLGLKFTSGPSRLEWFISSDMFYVEVVLESNGHIKDVKIHHDGTSDRQSCEEMKISLENRDFKDFTLQLEGLISIYNLNADKIIKSKAFTSLQYLETDISQLADLQSSYASDPFDIIHKSDVGFVHRRRGGHPMKIIYFISPYDLLDLTKNTYKPLTLDVPDVDYSVALCLESSSTNKLQTQPLVKVIKSERMDENNDVHQPTPVYDELTTVNTNLLPACFIMKLKERMPICELLINKMREITDLDVKRGDGPVPILTLIKREILIKHSECEDDSNIVTLPDQRHCYIMSDDSDMQAYIVQCIPFSHPVHVSKILSLLRQQALFNSFIASCIRPKASKDTAEKSWQNVLENNTNRDNEYSNGFGLKLFGNEDFKNLSNFNESPQKAAASDVIMFEVIPLSLQQITVSFEHPVDETLMTAELDLSDVSNLRCNISMASEETNTSVTNAQECAGRALQRSFSIPATMRVLIRLWENLPETSDEEDANESSTNNDVADLNESVNNNLEGDAGKENGERGSSEFNPSVAIKMEAPDSCENSMDGFSSLGAEQMFRRQNSSHGFQSSYDVEMAAVSAPASAASHPFEGPIPFLDNASEQPLYGPKAEPADYADNSFFRKKSSAGGDNFGGPREIVIDSSSDSEPPDTSKEALADAKDPSPGSTSSGFSALTELATDLPPEKPVPMSEFDMDHGMMEMNDLEDVQQFLKLTENKMPKNEDGNTLPSSVLPEHVLPPISLTAVSLPSSATLTSQGSMSQIAASVGSSSHSTAAAADRIRTPDSIAGLNLPPSVTITAVPMRDVEERNKERKKLKSDEERARIQRYKKKRKREDDLAGPPEKFRNKSDAIFKGLPLSLKCNSAVTVTPRCDPPNDPLPKCTSMSSTQSHMLNCGSPNSGLSNNNNNTIKKSSVVGSPGLSSPKHSLTSSPKSASSGSSGKPSMSTLKSAVTSPSASGKANSDCKKSYKESAGRENKEMKSSNGSGSSSRRQSPKPKSTSLKFKTPEVTISPMPSSSSSPPYGGSSPNNVDLKLVAGPLVAAHAKPAFKVQHLASIVDKLNKQQVDKRNNGSSNSGSPTSKETKAGQLADPKSAQAASKVSGEYTIKTHSGSSDGMKVIISNKSRKEQASNKSASAKASLGGNSSKTGVGMGAGSGSGLCKKSSSSTKLAPGAAGGPVIITSKHSSKAGSSSTSSSTFKSKSNHSPKSAHNLDPNRKDKIRPPKTYQDKPLFSSSTQKRSSPSTQSESVEDDKPYKPLQYNLLNVKPLNTNFQIPKIKTPRGNAPGESEPKKAADEAETDHPKDGPVKGDSISPAKLYLNPDEGKTVIEPMKSPASSYEAKKSSLSETSLDIIPNPPQHQMTPNCSISAGVQSSDSIKSEIPFYEVYGRN